MSAEIRDFVSCCTICETYRSGQAREDLQPQELPSRPWQKIDTDLFVIGQQTFLIMVAYWSNFFEVLETEQKQAQLSYLDAPDESDVAWLEDYDLS